MSSYLSLLRQQASRRGSLPSAGAGQKRAEAQQPGQHWGNEAKTALQADAAFVDRQQVERPRRFQISRRGTLGYQEHRFACLVQDISEKGMLLICNYDLEIGLELDVHFELEPGSGFSGRIRVRHFNDGCFGAELLEADSESQRNWNRFLVTHYSGQPKLPERRTRI